MLPHDPLVCCVMLTRDRPEMARRAVECFRRQTYRNKKLLIWESSSLKNFSFNFYRPENEHVTEDVPDFTIGELRNRANTWWYSQDANILMHWDDDDWSHPNRIEEQVALLKASGKQAVGYRDLLFWRSCPQCHGFDDYCADVMTCETCKRSGGEAWLYSNPDPRYCLGTSLCYWRETWERRPFPDLSRGEDKAWLREVESMGVTSIVNPTAQNELGVPRMIASVHAGNTSTPDPSTSSNFKRVPEWDSYCRERMAL